MFDPSVGPVISVTVAPDGALWYTTNEGQVRRYVCTGPQCPCLGDVDSNGGVGFNDLAQLLANWGPCTAGPCPWNFNGDASVGFVDLTILLAAWGPCNG
jgi:hypothetical protein